MEILKLALVISLTGCYSPALGDCTVSCSSETDCAAGQSCLGGMCSHEGVACIGAPHELDAQSAEQDAEPTPPDAEPEPPPPQGVLRVKLAEQGLVHVPNQTDCDSITATECMYIVPLEVPITLEAEPHENRLFERWEEGCIGQLGTTCTITPLLFETRVTAKFRKP